MVGQQLWFSGFEPPEAVGNLFLALVPPPVERSLISDRAMSLRDELSLNGRLIKKACLHISVIGFGRWPGPPASLAEAIDGVLRDVRTAPFDVTFDYAMSFSGPPNRRPFVLRSEAVNATLQALYQNLAGALKAAKLIASAPRSFTPHVTLLYDNQLIAQREISPIGWTVKDVVLVQSFVGQGRHAVVRRWPLVANEKVAMV